MTEEEAKNAEIIARQDRIPIWSLSYLFIGILGIGYIFIFFDIFNINVSFIQTALTLGWATSPTASAITSLEGFVVLLNLIGYVIGALILSPLSDRFGRRDMLIVTLLITGLGSIFNALVTSYPQFALARFITGIGVGADLAIVNSYLNEVAPKNGRARYTSFLFVLAGIGTVLAVWLGLILTTPAAAFPYGLSFAVGGAGWFATNGWRLMYGIGGFLALFGVLLRFGLPESTRWLITHGRPKEAERIVSEMEARALDSLEELPPLPVAIPIVQKVKPAPYSEILKNALYRNRTILLFSVWFFGYMTVYINAAGLSSLLAGVGYAFPENGMVVALGIFGFLIAGVMAAFVGDKMERKLWLPIAAAITFIGGIAVAFGLHDFHTCSYRRIPNLLRNGLLGSDRLHMGHRELSDACKSNWLCNGRRTRSLRRRNRLDNCRRINSFGSTDTYSVHHNRNVPDNFGNHRTIWTKDRKQKIRRSLTLKSKMELQRWLSHAFFTFLSRLRFQKRNFGSNLTIERRVAILNER